MKRLSINMMLLTFVLGAVPMAHAAAILPGFSSDFLAGNDDGSTAEEIAFGFSINFYGVSHTSAWLNNNGNITFDASLSTFTPTAITGSSQPMIAPFFGDVETSPAISPPTTDLMRYGTGTHDSRPAFGVTWNGPNGVGYYNNSPGPNRNRFQLVLVDRSNIAAGDFDFMFNYDQIQWEAGQASSSDNQGCGGVSAHAGWTNGVGTFEELDGSGVDGAFLDSGTCVDGSPYIGAGANALISDHTSNTDVDGRYLWEVRNGIVVPPDPTVPEPASMLLFGMGLAGAAAAGRRRRSPKS